MPVTISSKQTSLEETVVAKQKMNNYLLLYNNAKSTTNERHDYYCLCIFSNACGGNVILL